MPNLHIPVGRAANHEVAIILSAAIRKEIRELKQADPNFRNRTEPRRIAAVLFSPVRVGAPRTCDRAQCSSEEDGTAATRRGSGLLRREAGNSDKHLNVSGRKKLIGTTRDLYRNFAPGMADS